MKILALNLPDLVKIEEKKLRKKWWYAYVCEWQRKERKMEMWWGNGTASHSHVLSPMDLKWVNQNASLSSYDPLSPFDLSQNEWTVTIAAQTITKDAGVTVTQGASTGILKTTLTGADMTSVVISTNAGVTFVNGVELSIDSGGTPAIVDRRRCQRNNPDQWNDLNVLTLHLLFRNSPYLQHYTVFVLAILFDSSLQCQHGAK